MQLKKAPPISILNAMKTLIAFALGSLGFYIPSTAPPLKLANYLLARIKVMSNLDITEHRVPQDGRFKLIVSRKRAVDFRVSVCPTLFGEKIVLRILDPSHTFSGIEQLGMNLTQQEALLYALKTVARFYFSNRTYRQR